MSNENKFTKEEFLRAVRRARTLRDTPLSKRLGVNRSTVWRYKNTNPKIVEEAQELLRGSTEAFKSKTKMSIDEFSSIPSVAEWIEIQKRRMVSASVIRRRSSILNNICYHLKTTPDALSVDQCAELVYKAKVASDNDEDFLRGLKYYVIRKPIRSWFQLMGGVSGEYLTSKGIDAGRSKGTGSQAKEKISKEERALFEKNVLNAVKKAVQDLGYDWDYEKIVHASNELLGLAYFMYYSATRISATLGIMLNDPKHRFAGSVWEVHVTDKGKRGGIEWQKRLIDDGKDKLEEYISKRFDIPVDEIAIRTPDMEEKLFPILGEDYDFERTAMKYALRYAGSKVSMPNHAWRHTFAQDWLHASDWNYELGAEIGGWKDTGTMKLSYGAMSDDAIVRGLKRSMGLQVEDVTYELRW